MKVVSIDIGSTWTKGALFSLANNTLVLEKQQTCKTTLKNLASGFFALLDQIAPNYEQQLLDESLTLTYSSSAKGGLAVAAIGIVPEITLETAKITAYSAGAKITNLFPYLLTTDDINTLESNQPDILLLTGGTDGGNSEYVLKNAQKLATSSITSSIIYAGNRSVADQVETILETKELHIVDNVLPELEIQTPQPAREAIRKIFLDKIVSGKGLDQIIEKVGVQPLPTPFAVYELVKQISETMPGWDNLMLLDLGGATTDVYSSCQNQFDTGVVFRGMPEPGVKRTVEGDLGLRVSIETATKANHHLLQNQLEQLGIKRDQLDSFVTRISNSPEHISTRLIDKQLDKAIAGNCIHNAAVRHAGRMHKVVTADGPVNVQTGRNLSKLRKLIGSGGYLANSAEFAPSEWLNIPVEDNRGRKVLLPENFKYYRDELYLIPLLANIAQRFPREATQAAISNLKQHEPNVVELRKPIKALF